MFVAQQLLQVEQGYTLILKQSTTFLLTVPNIYIFHAIRVPSDSKSKVCPIICQT